MNGVINTSDRYVTPLFNVMQLFYIRCVLTKTLLVAKVCWILRKKLSLSTEKYQYPLSMTYSLVAITTLHNYYFFIIKVAETLYSLNTMNIHSHFEKTAI